MDVGMPATGVELDRETEGPTDPTEQGESQHEVMSIINVSSNAELFDLPTLV